MKVTALLPNELVDEVKRISHGKNITEALNIALSEWVQLKKLSELHNHLASHPLVLSSPEETAQVRDLNRRKRGTR